jgi:SAM-dependent methyltransferase
MGKRIPARVFGEVAGDYDRVRPPYPVAVFDDVMDYGRLAGVPGRALEVGAGTGRATVPFAARGVPVVAVEPDDAMADVLARRVAGFPGVEIVRRSFEEYRPAGRFGLLYSAEAWHWTLPETRWSSAAGALAEGGTLALFFNNERIADPALRASIVDVFARHAPAVVLRDEPATPEYLWHRWPGDEMSACVAFGDLAGRIYRRDTSVPRDDYLGLMRTRSQFRMLAPGVRETLLAATAEMFGDEVPLMIETTLLLARRRPD